MKTFELLRRRMNDTIKAEEKAKKDPSVQEYLYEQAKMLDSTISDIFEEVDKTDGDLDDLTYDELYSLISAVHICNRINCKYIQKFVDEYDAISKPFA